MSTSEFRERARAMLRKDEGWKLVPYLDSVGVWTAGCGRNLQAMGLTKAEIDELRATGITKALAMQWLDEDITNAELRAQQDAGEGAQGARGLEQRAPWKRGLFHRPRR